MCRKNVFVVSFHSACLPSLDYLCRTPLHQCVEGHYSCELCIFYNNPLNFPSNLKHAKIDCG